MAQVKTCSSPIWMPSLPSRAATSRRVRWLLLVSTQNGNRRVRNALMKAAAPGTARSPQYNTPSMSIR